MKAEILSIGTELLLGEITDTNSRDISRELFHIGMEVYHKSTIGDNKFRIVKELETAFQRADLVITTGGLGPTQDDLTKEAAARFLDRKMILDPQTLENLEAYFLPRGLTINEGNRRQAYFPEGSRILPNSRGTAPGLILDFILQGSENDCSQKKYLIILPGPPKEMEPMLCEQVIPYLKELTGRVFCSITFSLAGIGEGHMEEKILDLIRNQSNPTLAPYAKEKALTLRVTAAGTTLAEAKDLLEPMAAEVRNRLSEYIFAEEEMGLEEWVGKTLIEKGLTLATAESCTGGLLSGRLIEVPGISAVFKEGFITYANEAKVRTLGVSEEILESYGAVSEQAAKAMAIGAAKIAGTDLGLSVTGIAGPEGGTEEKPVGTVYLALHTPTTTQIKKIFIKGSREMIRRRSVSEALNLLREKLK